MALTRAMWILACVLTLAPLSAWGQTTYYVRTSGDDDDDGLTPATAFETIEEAADHAGPGDTIYVGGGTYSDEIKLKELKGTSASPIRFVADTTGAQTGDSGTVRFRDDDGLLLLEDCDHLIFTGFVFDGDDGDSVIELKNDSTGVVFSGCSIEDSDKALLELDDNSEVELRECTLDDSDADAIEVKKSTLTIIGGVITRVDDRAIDVDDEESVLVLRGVTFEDVGAGVRLKKGTAEATNCLMRNVGGDAFDCDDDKVRLTVWHCTLVDVDGDGIDAEKGVVALHNTIMSDVNRYGVRIDDATLTHSHNIFHDVSSGAFRGGPSLHSSESTADPLFAASDNARLTSTSPAIDAGADASLVTSVDLDGAARPDGSGYDIGCYESSDGLVAAPTPYHNDFEGTIGAEWSSPPVSSDGDLSTFLGRLWDETDYTLRVTVEPGETYSLLLSMYIFEGWEGDGSNVDWVTITVDGAQVFRESFDQQASPQTYPKQPDRMGNFAFSSGSDSVYDWVRIDFVAPDSVVDIVFNADVSYASGEWWGIDNVHVLKEADADLILPIYSDISGAVSFNVQATGGLDDCGSPLWSDIDADGDLDVFITGRTARNGLQSLGGSFTWQSMGSVRGQGAVGDVTGDGAPDIWTARTGSSDGESLFINDGTGVFSGAGDLGMIAATGNGATALIDADADGRLDVFMASGNGNWVGYARSGSPITLEPSNDPSLIPNAGTDLGRGGGMSVAHLNDDRTPDMLIHAPVSGVLASTEVEVDGEDVPAFERDLRSLSAGVSSTPTGSAWGDYDNDGDADVFIAGASSSDPGRLLRNDDGTFVDVTDAAGIDVDGVQRSCAWGDMDNDGDLDLYVVTGSGSDNVLYRNNGDTTFSAGDLGAGLSGDYVDAVFVDYDADGDADLSVVPASGTAVLLENRTDDGRGMMVRLVGAGHGGTNPSGVGVRVELYNADASQLLQFRDLGAARGFGCEPLWAHFGGVEPGTSYVVRAHFLSGTVSSQVDPASVSSTIGSRIVSGLLTIEEPDAALRVVRWREAAP